MGFQGNQLNYLDTLFRVGYALFLIVSSIFPDVPLEPKLNSSPRS